MLVSKVPWKQHTLPMRSIFISLDCEEGFWRGEKRGGLSTPRCNGVYSVELSID
jgi:hypothetical protein